MYRGQVTALLGHNGAGMFGSDMINIMQWCPSHTPPFVCIGKTTTISMLTGTLLPTAGYTLVCGRDSRTEMRKIRQNIGICLQHNCLFPLLTVREHVEFFARVKGVYASMSRKDAESHVNQAINDLALNTKRDTFSRRLSGGMKRKLSVAIAFCGGSEAIFLDEPTSGM
jgi:ABC-type multidrug transport system ATPase subunit